MLRSKLEIGSRDLRVWESSPHQGGYAASWKKDDGYQESCDARNGYAVKVNVRTHENNTIAHTHCILLKAKEDG